MRSEEEVGRRLAGWILANRDLVRKLLHDEGEGSETNNDPPEDVTAKRRSPLPGLPPSLADAVDDRIEARFVDLLLKHRDLIHRLAAVETEAETKPEPEGVLTVSEVAKLLKLSPATVYQLVAQERLPSVRLGRRIMVPRRELEDLLRRGH